MTAKQKVREQRSTEMRQSERGGYGEVRPTTEKHRHKGAKKKGRGGYEYRHESTDVGRCVRTRHGLITDFMVYHGVKKSHFQNH